MDNISLIVYNNCKQGNYLIERFSGIHGVGKFVRISNQDMQEHGLEIIIKYLTELPPNEKSELGGFSDKEEKAFHRQHRHVYISIENESSLNVGALHREGSGFVTFKNEIIRLSLPSNNQELLSALNKALEIAD